ncbi:MAG: sugar phosphate isomerase/epimerase [Planctomycetes bacterium]|nr:sugar phosphate isomerase/epimerase [Planctomycetota bacterium]
MFVAGSTECFPKLPLDQALQRLVDLEYSHVELDVFESGNHLKPSEVHNRLEEVVHLCRDEHRLTPVALYVDIEPEIPAYYDQWKSCCRLAKALKIATIAVRSGELGTPFNAEVERLREMVRIASLEGVVVGLKTEVGHMTQDPATAGVLCDNVRGLGITLDPSHYVYGPYGGADYDRLFKHVCHVQLRDTSKSKLQTRVGQGEIEYGRLVTQLGKLGYNRVFSVNIIDLEDPEVDHYGEMRKLRLLLESLL